MIISTWTTVEGWLIRDVVDENEGMRRPVVALGDTTKPENEDLLI